MHWKSMLFTMVINIFLMLALSVVLEYVSFTERFNSLQDVVDTSVESALSGATRSEEFFSDQFQLRTTSASRTGSTSTTSDYTDEDGNLVSETTKTASGSRYADTIFYDADKKNFTNVNIYYLGQYFDMASTSDDSLDDGLSIPASKQALDDFMENLATNNKDKGGYTTSSIYKWLYGDTGQNYTANAMKWARNNVEFQSVYDDDLFLDNGEKVSDRVTLNHSDFHEWYKNIGYKQETVGYLKYKNSTGDDFEVGTFRYPVLWNMGLTCMCSSVNAGAPVGDMGTEAPTIKGYSASGTSLSLKSGTGVDSNIEATADNFVSVLKIGKVEETKKDDFVFSVYYLTPMSLGVTYVPMKVFTPLVINNINVFARLKRLGGSSVDANYNQTLGEGTGLIPSQVRGAKGWVDMSDDEDVAIDDVGTGDPDEEELTSYYVNDGLVEYDLNSIACKVDYFFVNFNDTVKHDYNATIISRVNGTVKGSGDQTALRSKTLDVFKYNTSINSSKKVANNDKYNLLFADVADQHIVAKLQVKVKVSIPYKSSLLQWFKKTFTSSSHYGIPLYNVDGNIDMDEDGLWYTYTTYFMQDRG